MNPVPVPLEGSRERLSLIQMILLRHLKAGVKKKGANRRCDCDGYRPGATDLSFEAPKSTRRPRPSTAR